VRAQQRNAGDAIVDDLTRTPKARLEAVGGAD
jgi:hypothetical protein